MYSRCVQLNEEERPSLSLERTQNGQVSSTSLQSQPSFSSSQVPCLCDMRFDTFIVGTFIVTVTHHVFSVQVSMAIPDLTSYVVLNPKLAGLSQQLQLARYISL
jgi:CCR4-NOT transcription complex subunit 1